MVGHVTDRVPSLERTPLMILARSLSRPRQEADPKGGAQGRAPFSDGASPRSDGSVLLVGRGHVPDAPLRTVGDVTPTYTPSFDGMTA